MGTICRELSSSVKKNITHRWRGNTQCCIFVAELFGPPSPGGGVETGRAVTGLSQSRQKVSSLQFACMKNKKKAQKVILVPFFQGVIRVCEEHFHPLNQHLLSQRSHGWEVSSVIPRLSRKALLVSRPSRSPT